MNAFGYLASLIAVGAVALLGCGGDEGIGLHLRRVPTLEPGCGIGPDANTVRVRALGDFPVTARSSVTFPLGEPITISQFPAQIEGIAVEVFGASSDTVAIGRTGAFDFAELDDGDEVSIFLAPRDGACAVEPMQAARSGAHAVMLGSRVLVLGGRDGSRAVTTVELYNPATASFLPGADDKF